MWSRCWWSTAFASAVAIDAAHDMPRAHTQVDVGSDDRRRKLQADSLTDANFQAAINACLAVDPVNGNCPDEPHGASKYSPLPAPKCAANCAAIVAALPAPPS